MRKVGVWIDKKKAKVIRLTNGKISRKTINSGADRKPRVKGEKSKKTARTLIGFDFESNQRRKYQEDLKRFFKDVANYVSGDDEIYICGPSDARHLLEKETRNIAGLYSRIKKVETAGYLTDNQIVARVKKFFDPVRVKKKRKLPKRH